VLFFKVNNNKPPVVGLSLSVAFLKKKAQGKTNGEKRNTHLNAGSLRPA